MKMVSLQLSDEEWTVLEQMVFFGRFKSRSEAIREGIAMLLREFKTKPEVMRAARIAHQGARSRPREECAHLAKPVE